MHSTFVSRTIGTIAAALMLVGVSQPASAQSLRTQIDTEMKRISYENPGSALVFAGCATAAAEKYHETGSNQSGLNVLIGCAAVGCAFTDSYSNCISVNSRMFLMMISRP